MAAQTPLTKDDSKASSSNGTSTSSKISKLFNMNKAPIVSTGRGGAGNIGTDTSAPATSTSLLTPTIKAQTYTTGRGGQGNMAPNDPSVPAHAEMARVAQDVGAPAHATREVQNEGHAYLHHGRGGGGNLVKVEGAGAGEGGSGGKATRVIEGENGDWEEEGTGAPVEPAGAGASGTHRGSMDKSREGSAARDSQSEKPRQASARSMRPGAASTANSTANSEEKLKVSSRAPGTAEVVTGTVQTRGRSVAEGAEVEGEKARSGSRGIIGAGRGMLNRLRSPSGKKN